MNLILADTSVWVDHLRTPSSTLESLSDQERLIMHPLIIGELSMGNLRDRPNFLRGLRQMEAAPSAREDEVAGLVENHELFGLGISWIDAHLLASALLATNVLLWSRDRRLIAAAGAFGRAAIFDR